MPKQKSIKEQVRQWLEKASQPERDLPRGLMLEKIRESLGHGKNCVSGCIGCMRLNSTAIRMAQIIQNDEHQFEPSEEVRIKRGLLKEKWTEATGKKAPGAVEALAGMVTQKVKPA
jgi:hypothetical protein